MQNKRRPVTGELKVFWPWDKVRESNVWAACRMAGVGPMKMPPWWRRPAVIDAALRMQREMRRTDSAAKRYSIRARAAIKIARHVSL